MRAIAINITIPSDWHAAIQQYAAASGTTVSALLSEVGRDKLPEKVVARLSRARGRGRPRKTRT